MNYYLAHTSDWMIVHSRGLAGHETFRRWVGHFQTKAQHLSSRLIDYPLNKVTSYVLLPSASMTICF
jgi:hypothetical protein